jgi:radical SAM superfamily enzyme YgiQ (UPF0313 family)
MKLTIIHPCIGRRVGQPYIRSWQMEPLPPAALAGLTPKDVQVTFYDDRMERIPYDDPTDLVAISVETYTARRAYQIASEYRRRGVPVVMGGFHATLWPEEVSRFAEAVVIGEAENIWEQVLVDAERGALKPYYQSPQLADLSRTNPRREIYVAKRYLPISLIEAGRGCSFHCDFCSIQAFFHNTQRFRPFDNILTELAGMDRKPLVFFVDDNLIAHPETAKEFLRQLIPLRIRWVSQASINVAFDEELLRLMAASGCQGILIGFESLNPANLRMMQKGINLIQGGYEPALANLRAHNIRLYITFLFGYDEDTQASFAETVRFAIQNRFYIAAFNHITPFPGTPLYRRLSDEGRLLFDAWWLDERYRYNQVPFRPQRMTPAEVQAGCVDARREFYTWRNIIRRGVDRVNRSTPLMGLAYYWINGLFRNEVLVRNAYPLGDEGWRGQIIPVRQHPIPYVQPVAVEHAKP